MVKRFLSAVLSIVIILTAIPTVYCANAATKSAIQIGDYLLMGKYYGEPILWRCVDVDENGPLMLSDKLLSIKVFDASLNYEDMGSSSWEYSNIRAWLNSNASSGNVVWPRNNPPKYDQTYDGEGAYEDEAGFLNNFNSDELNLVKSVSQKSIVSPYDYKAGNYDSGSEVFSLQGLKTIDSDIVCNYDIAYSKNITDKFFLLDVKQLKNLYNNGDILGYDYYLAKPTARVANEIAQMIDPDGESLRYYLEMLDNKWDYALRTPDYPFYDGSNYFDENILHVIPGSGYIYWDGSVDESVIGGDFPCDSGGIRPAFYLSDQAKLSGGDGSENNPYCVGYETTSYELLITKEMNLSIGEEGIINASITINDEKVYDGSGIKWSSSDYSVVKITHTNDEGEILAYVKGVSSGYAVITAEYGDVAAECEVTVGENGTLSIYTNEPSYSVTIGDNFLVGVSIDSHGEESADLSNISFSIENKDILSLGETTRQNDILFQKIYAQKVGNSKIKISDYNSGETATVEFTVNDVKGNAYTIYNVPSIFYDNTNCNFANFNGLYIDNFNKTVHEDGNCDISFDVYNQNFIHGVVEVYNSDDKLIRAVDIGNYSYEGSLNDIWNSATGLFKTAVNGNIWNYRSTTLSKMTPVNFENIPMGGYLRITTDTQASCVCGLINSFDILSQLYGYTKSLTKDKNSLKEALSKTTISIILNMPEEFAKNWTKTFSKKITDKVVNSEDAAASFVDSLKELFSSGEYEEIFMDVTAKAGYGALFKGFESWFEAGAGFIGSTLKGLFTFNEIGNTILQINQFKNHIDSGSIFIHIPEEDKRTCSDVTVECDMDDDVALDVYVFDEAEAKEHLKKIEEYMKKKFPQPGETHPYHPNTDVFADWDISLVQNGKEYNPNHVSVRIKLPNELRGKVGELIVYRIDDDNVTPISAVSDGEYVTFVTDHFSAYVLTNTSFDNILNTEDQKNFSTSDWAVEEVEKAAEYGLIPDRLLNADLTERITREEFAATAVKLYEKMSGKSANEASNPFTDIDSSPYRSEILKAYNLDITNGTSSTAFSPYDEISREQMATMLCRALKAAKIEDWSLSRDYLYLLDADGVEKFSDDDNISDFAFNAVYYMAKNGIINGVDNSHFAPKNVTAEQTKLGYASATREQAVAIAVRCYEKLRKSNLDRLSIENIELYDNGTIIVYKTYGDDSMTYDRYGAPLIYRDMSDYRYDDDELWIDGGYLNQTGFFSRDGNPYFTEDDMWKCKLECYYLMSSDGKILYVDREDEDYQEALYILGEPIYLPAQHLYDLDGHTVQYNESRGFVYPDGTVIPLDQIEANGLLRITAYNSYNLIEIYNNNRIHIHCDGKISDVDGNELLWSDEKGFCYNNGEVYISLDLVKKYLAEYGNFLIEL